MQIGAVYPELELPTDPGTIRAIVRGVEELGYRHILVYDHVLGADPAVHEGWDGPHDIDTPFHEPFTLMGFLAGITSLELGTSVVVAPQRPTALLAKQAAEVDVLTEGRLRLGLGVGWNSVEFEALGQDFATRGKRLEEQIGLLRRFWSEKSVTYEGQFDKVTGAGLLPLPVQRPIPIWLGGQSEVAYRRIGRLGDGWFPYMDPWSEVERAQAVIREAAIEAGRDPTGIGMDVRIPLTEDVESLAKDAQRWQEIGATHLSINTMGSKVASVDAHLEVLALAAQALELGR